MASTNFLPALLPQTEAIHEPDHPCPSNGNPAQTRSGQADPSGATCTVLACAWLALLGSTVIRREFMKIWDCKIGEVDESLVPDGGSQPMREAVREAYVKLTGQEPTFIFCGWGAELTEAEREVVEGRTV